MLITFRGGHASRHLIGTGLSAEEVEATIKEVIEKSIAGAMVIGSFWGRVLVKERIIEYRAFPIGDETINVGTYYIP